MDLARAESFSRTRLADFFNLVKETSCEMYKTSGWGWSPENKKAEISNPSMRYITVEDEKHELRGFVSVMPTDEDDMPVLYCYEIHLKPELIGCVTWPSCHSIVF